MNKALKKGFSFLLILVMMLGCFAVSIYGDTPKLADGKTIRIGFFEMAGFQYYDNEGNPAGYNVEYLNMISGFTGWNYEYVPVDSYSEALAMLKNKELDLVAPVMVTSEWMEEYDYSSFSLGTGYYVLVTNADNTELNYEDWEAISKTKISVPEGYPITENFIEFMVANELELEIVSYPTSEEAMYAMWNGEVDCSLTSLISVDERYKVLSKYCSSLMYFITWDGNTKLIDELNYAMGQVENLYATELQYLEKEYFTNYSKQYFSKEEMEYIQNNRIIRVAYTSSNIPISYTDEKGNYNGITHQILERVAADTGLIFEYVEIPDTSIDSNFISENNIDLIADVENNDVNKNLDAYYLSVPYLYSKKIFVSKEGKDFVKNGECSVAIHSGSKTIEKAIRRYYPNIQIENYNSMGACFEALSDDRVDYVLGNEYNLEYYMSKPQNENYTIIPTAGVVDELCFATYIYEGGRSADACRTLIHIIDKSVAEILDETSDDIVITEKLEAKYEYTFLDVVYQYRYIIIMAFIFIVFVIAVFIYIIFNNLKHIRKHKADASASIIEKKRYQLVVDNSEDMIYEIGMEGNIGISSERIQETFGWELPKNLKKNSFNELMEALRVHPDDCDQLRNQYSPKISVEGIEKAVVQIFSEYEGYVWCEISIVPLKDEENRVISYVGKITNIDDEVKAKQKQGHELSEAKIQNENLEELLVNAFVDNVTDIIELNLESGECTFYVIEKGDLVKKTFEEEWNEYLNILISNMETEDANRLHGMGNRARLSRMNVGESVVYHYKSKYNAKKRKVGKKYIPYTTKIRCSMINGQKVAIISSIDNSDVMKVEQEYVEQKEEYANRLFESQKFLFNAISGTYITTFKINLDDGSIKGFYGTEEGIVSEYKIESDWKTYCDVELLPYLSEDYAEIFRNKASLEALNKLDVGEFVKVSFKAMLNSESLDPCNEYNFFVVNFKILMENEKKIASVIFQCDSDNVKDEIEKHKKKENILRKKRIMALLDNTTDIIYEVDIENNECIVTGEKENIYGWDLDTKITNVSLEKLLDIWGVYPEDRFVVGEATQKILDKKATISKEVRVKRADDRYVWSRISAVPVLNDDGEISSILCKIVDINDKVKEKTNHMRVEAKDKLTGLLTQSALRETTEMYLRDNSAKNDALILIDMDQLKTVNETLDRRVGDKVLAETAKKLQIIFSNYDYIGKFESDTFCVYVKNIPVGTLEDKLVWALEKLKDSYSYNGKIVQVSASIGVAYCMTDKATFKELYEFAYATVYEAKSSGKGQYAIKRFF